MWDDDDDDDDDDDETQQQVGTRKPLGLIWSPWSRFVKLTGGLQQQTLKRRSKKRPDWIPTATMTNYPMTDPNGAAIYGAP